MENIMEPNISLEMLKKVTVFAGIEEEKLAGLCSCCKLVSFKKGEKVISEGTVSSEIFIIIRGRLKIVLNAGDRQIDLIELHAGHCVGEASVIGVQSHSASVIATEDSDLMELGRKTLMDMAQNDKDLFSLIILNIARELARRLYNTDHLLSKFAQQNPSVS
jgi:CRP-like cAMP-binding protein